jgi:hypothetical protein
VAILPTSRTNASPGEQEPAEEAMPTIFHLKRLLKSYQKSDQLLLFCDLHGETALWPGRLAQANWGRGLRL